MNRLINIKTARTAIFYFLIFIGGIVTIFPVFYMFSASLMYKSDIFSMPINIFPPSIRFANYVEIFTVFNIHTYILNSVFVVVSVIIINGFFSTLTGYSLAKFEYAGKKIIFSFIISTMMIPFTVIVIPVYLIVASLGWTNSYWGLIVPVSITPFGVFLMRQFILDLPNDYIDAARMDGAKEFSGIFIRLIIPLCKPAISSLAIMTFVMNWNSFLWPLIVVSYKRYQTLPLGISVFTSMYGEEWHLLLATSVVALLPAMVIFLVLQSTFIEGMTGMSGIKG